MRIGVEGTYLERDNRGMGRYVRNILACWRGRAEVVLLARRHGQVRWLRENHPWATACTFRARPPLDVCWFPWNRVDCQMGCPSIVTLHDLAPFHVFEPGARPIRADQERFRQAALRADGIIAVTRAGRDEIVSRFAVDPSRVTVIPEGIDAAFRFAEVSGRPVERPFVLAVGTMEPRKNLLRLLDAVPAVFRETGRALVVAGSLPPRRRSWWRRADPLWDRLDALGEAVIYEHRPDDARLAALYRTCDAYVFPTLYEGFGLPLLEALISGVPVAASRIPPLVEIGGSVPEWFDPLDVSDIARGIVEVLARPRVASAGEREEMGRRFSWESVAEAVLRHLQEAARRYMASTLSASTGQS